MLIVVLAVVVVGVGALYYYGGNFPSLGSGGQESNTSQVTVKSAQLASHGSLLLDLVNSGSSSSQTIEVLNGCSPDFTDCEAINANPMTFVLPAGNEYTENLTIPQCGFSSQLCPFGAPIHGQTNYYQVRVTFTSGTPQTLAVAAPVTGVYPLISLYSAPIQNDKITIASVQAASVVVFGNLSGKMTISMTVDRVSYPATASLLNQTSYELGIPQRNVLVTASTLNCGNSCPNVVGGGNIILTTGFSTVTAGIRIGTYYLVSINFQNYVSCFLWVKVTSA